jgi:FHA domain
MIVRLLVSNDKANVKKVVLRSDTVIGRSSDCNLRIASKEVSRRHCSILLSDRAVRVRDLGSANGTFLNGLQIEANVDVPAPPGSELEVGNVRFVINYDAPVPPELEASTAEVPNAVLQARLARNARDSGLLTAERHQSVPRSDVLRSGGESAAAEAVDSQMDTYRGSPGETLHDGEDAATRDETFNAADPDDEADRTMDERIQRPVDDDTFALKESDVSDAEDRNREAVAQEFPGVDETISMQVEDVIIDTPAPPAVQDAEPEESATPRKGWKSMFGLFGGKKRKPSGEAPVETEDAEAPLQPAEPDAARRLEPAPERGTDPERNRKTVPEFNLPPRNVDPEGIQQTLPEFEPVGGNSEAVDDTIQFSADESVSPQTPDAHSPEPAAGDTNLQDFFRQMSQE